MYRVENKEIIINGWENGIADDPYSGIADIRNMNIISVPKESSVNFQTVQSSFSGFSGAVASASAANDTVTYSGETGTPVAGMVVVFAGGSLPAGITAGTQSASADTNIYWIGNVNTGTKTFKIYTDYARTSLVNITSDGTGTFGSINMTQPRYTISTYLAGTGTYYFTLDSVGRCWATTGPAFPWSYLGNITRANANGNGLVAYTASNGTPYLFVFRNALIDWMSVATLGTWNYAWQTMNTGASLAYSHHAIVAQRDNVAYYCDKYYLGSFFQTASGTPFDPSNAGTYTWTSKALSLPYTDIAQCVVELGNIMLIAGTKQYIYPWNGLTTSFQSLVLIADNFGLADLSTAQPNIPRMITLNTNTYIFAGVRGRIYITNATQAQLYKKIPDHLSGTVEPYYIWGGIGFNKNQLYFGVIATANDGTANNNYGGLWAIDMDTKAIRLVNQLSYASYAGYATTFLPILTTGSGSGFFVGWDSGSSTYGIDSTISSGYSTYIPYIDTDNIPIGTLLKPTTSNNMEWKLAKPLTAGEGIKVSYRTDLSQSFTLVWEDTTVGVFSSSSSINWNNAQWIQFRIETKSTGVNTSSFVRLTELRLR